MVNYALSAQHSIVNYNNHDLIFSLSLFPYLELCVCVYSTLIYQQTN